MRDDIRAQWLYRNSAQHLYSISILSSEFTINMVTKCHYNQHTDASWIWVAYMRELGNNELPRDTGRDIGVMSTGHSTSCPAFMIVQTADPVVHQITKTILHWIPWLSQKMRSTRQMTHNIYLPGWDFNLRWTTEESLMSDPVDWKFIGLYNLLGE